MKQIISFLIILDYVLIRFDNNIFIFAKYFKVTAFQNLH